MQLKRGEQWHVALQISIKQRFVRGLHVFTNRATKQLKCLGTVPGATVLQTNIQYSTVQYSTQYAAWLVTLPACHLVCSVVTTCTGQT